MKTKTKVWIWVGVIILTLIIGNFMGANLFPKIKTVTETSSNGQYCYTTDPTVYLANSVTSLPSDWQTNGIGYDLCNQVNGFPNGHDCYITSIRPNYATNKINCVCKK